MRSNDRASADHQVGLLWIVEDRRLTRCDGPLWLVETNLDPPVVGRPNLGANRLGPVADPGQDASRRVKYGDAHEIDVFDQTGRSEELVERTDHHGVAGSPNFGHEERRAVGHAEAATLPN